MKRLLIACLAGILTIGAWAQGPIGGGGSGSGGTTVVAATWKGVWAGGTAYVAGDGVGYNGTAYIAIASSTGVTPGTDTTKWVVAGPAGPTGATGPAGSNGSNGTNGVDGKSILYGAADPTTEGNDGDFYINTTAHTLFGPKSGTWPAGASLVGPAGANGADGSNGADGVGVPAGGTTGQVLAKTSGTDYATQWVDRPVVIGATYNGTFANSLEVLRLPLVVTITVPQSCTNSRLELKTAATGSTTFTFSKCTGAGFTSCSSFGTAVVSASGKVASFTCASATTLTAGTDALVITAPSSADATAADLGLSLYATR